MTTDIVFFLAISREISGLIFISVLFPLVEKPAGVPEEMLMCTNQKSGKPEPESDYNQLRSNHFHIQQS